jgi:PncC family amidohydrolase
MNDLPIEVLIGELLRKRNLHLATAESCTGGLIGHRLTNVPGSSDYYLGGVIAYSNQIKMNQLGVMVGTLEKFGAVSQETVLEMARGVRQRLQAEIGLSVSGIAGPGGGSPEKPVGLTWVGLSACGYEQAWSYTWPGGRLRVKEQTAEQALQLLLNYLKQGG